MSLKVLLEDGRGGGNLANFDELGALLVTDRPEPPTITDEAKTTFRQFFTDTGSVTGVSDMRVDGSVTSQDFFIGASSAFDTYIMSISFEISDAGAVLSEFGNIGALVNGVRFFYEATDGVIDIHPGMLSNWDFVRLCQGNPTFGDGASAFQAPNVVFLSEAYIPILNFQQIFGYRWGLALKGGTNQRLVLRVRDDVTGVDSFNAIAYGFLRRRIE